jgi:hypothetical protein
VGHAHPLCRTGPIRCPGRHSRGGPRDPGPRPVEATHSRRLGRHLRSAPMTTPRWQLTPRELDVRPEMAQGRAPPASPTSCPCRNMADTRRRGGRPRGPSRRYSGNVRGGPHDARRVTVSPRRREVRAKASAQRRRVITTTSVTDQDCDAGQKRRPWRVRGQLMHRPRYATGWRGRAPPTHNTPRLI